MPAPTDRDLLADLAAHLDHLAQSVATLAVWRPHYETSAVYTVGGPSATFTLPSPYASPSEYCVVAVSFADAGSIAVAAEDSAVAPSSTTTFDPTVRRRQLAIYSTSPQLLEAWQPLEANGTLSIVTSIANSKGAWVAIQFRRRVNQHGVFAEG